ncbi:MAG: glycosyltransferase family 9 protein [Myxococcota bacterium]
MIRLGALGDVVRTLPAAAALRQIYPGAHLAWLVEPAAAGAVDAAGIADETLIFPRRELVEALRDGDAMAAATRLWAFARKLRARRFEVVVDFHGILKSGLLARLSGAPARYGYAPGIAKEGASLFVNHRIGLADPHVSRFQRNAALVRSLSPTVSFPEGPLLEPSPLAAARLTARLRISGREKTTGFALIHVGSSSGAAYKRYSPNEWTRVASLLEDAGVAVWIVAGPNRAERQLAEAVQRSAQGAAVLAPETRSFDDLLALIARASVFVSSDSGPMHAASLSGTPVVQLLGPTDPVHNMPWASTPWERVHVPQPCSPCRRGCAEARCMRAIEPEEVAACVLKLMPGAGTSGEVDAQ